MNPLAKLRQIRKAQRLLDELEQGETRLLIEYFPFVEQVFTPQAIPAVPSAPKPPPPPPKISYPPRSEEDDLHDALDIGFTALTFEPVEDAETEPERS